MKYVAKAWCIARLNHYRNEWEVFSENSAGETLFVSDRERINSDFFATFQPVTMWSKTGLLEKFKKSAQRSSSDAVLRPYEVVMTISDICLPPGEYTKIKGG